MSVTSLNRNSARNAPAMPLTATTSGSSADRSPPNTTSSSASTTGSEINSAFLTSCWARSPICSPSSGPPLTWTSGASISRIRSAAASSVRSSASSSSPPSRVTGTISAWPSSAIIPGVAYGSGTAATPATSRTSATARSTSARRPASVTGVPATTPVTEEPAGSISSRYRAADSDSVPGTSGTLSERRAKTPVPRPKPSSRKSPHRSITVSGRRVAVRASAVSTIPPRR